jgi:actin-like ATPase involved in cell morphogenesis
MGYDLGVDLGTSVTRAAVSRAGDEPRFMSECVPLDGGRTTLVSALYLGEDGSVLAGEQAERRGLAEPDRACRQFLQHLASGTPIAVGEVTHRPEELTAEMLRYVLHRVAEHEQEPAARVAVAHPASWDAHSRERLRTALREAGHSGVVLVPEPVAVAAHLAAQGRLEPGRTVAVFDFGGGSFDAAVVRRDKPDVFTLLGEPVAVASPCGADLEEVLFTRVLTELEDRVGSVDTDDPEVLAAMGRLLAACVAAKEALSRATAVTVPVLLPGLRSKVRFTRDAFEAMIRSALQAAVQALGTVTDSGHVRPVDLDQVLLTGGCAQVPLVAELLTAELQRPVMVHSDATTAVVLGTALAASRGMERVAETAPVSADWTSRGAEPDDPAPGVPARRPVRARPATAAAAGLAGMVAVAVPLALMAGTGSVDTETPVEFRAGAATTGPLVLTQAPGTNPPIQPGDVIPAPASGRLATAPAAVRRGAPAGSPVAGPIRTSATLPGAPAAGPDTAPLRSRRDPVSGPTSPDSTSPPPRQTSPSPFPPPFLLPPPTPNASTSPRDPSTTTRSENAPAETDTYLRRYLAPDATPPSGYATAQEHEQGAVGAPTTNYSNAIYQ